MAQTLRQPELRASRVEAASAERPLKSAGNLPAEMAWIQFVSGSMQGRVCLLSGAGTTIGRDTTNDVVVGDAEVAPHHARITLDETRWHLETLPWALPVTVDGRHVSEETLRHNAVVGLSPQTSFVFCSSRANARARGGVVSTAATPTAPCPQVTPTPSRQQLHTPRRERGDPKVQPDPDTRTQSVPCMRVPDHAPRRQASLRPTHPPTGPSETQVASEQPCNGVPYLEVRTERGRSCWALTSSRIDIGRDPGNDIVLQSGSVSARHLCIMREGDRHVLVHPHPEQAYTANGLLYQGWRILGTERFRAVLADGDTFRIGSDESSLVSIIYHDGTVHTEPLVPVKPIKLGEPVLTIGRAADCRIVLPHPQVSSRHALMIREGGTYRLLDQHSTNGVYVNGEPQSDYRLELGDEIRIGPYRLVYEATHLTEHDESRFVGIQAVDLSTTAPNGNVLLDHISLNIPPRAFVALVGGSGAGKSTLMDALNGLRAAQQGEVYYNGHDFYANRAAFSPQMGYVPQDDIVHKDMTVERALYFAAKLRLPSDFTDEQIEQRIQEVLEDVEMVPRRTLLVKKLSGGQRKRVSIALELLANPSILFLDEPTSGLDPGLDRKMMFLLRRLADRGRTVVLVTHATNNISACDFVCFLAQGGRLAYFGPPQEAQAYFGTSDFAEIYTSLEPTDDDPDIPARAAARFEASEACQRYIMRPLSAVSARAGSAAGPFHSLAASRAAGGSGTDAGRRRGTTSVDAVGALRPTRRNAGRQLVLLTRRRLELLRNDRITLILLLLQAPVMALMVMLLIRSSVGTGLFEQNRVVQCSPQITQTLIASSAAGETAGTPVRIGLNPSASGDPNAPVDCAQIRKLLRGDPSSQADAQMVQLATQYAQRRGGVDRALQDFIIPGSSLNSFTTLFILAFTAVITGCINGVREIVKEGPIYRRERAINLGILPYVGSKIGVMGAFAMLQSAMLVLIVHLFEPFHAGIFLPVLLEVYITVFLTALAGLMMGLAVSAVAANEDTANILLPFVLIPEVVFAGCQFPLKGLPLQLIGMLTPIRWAMVALGSTVGLHSDKLGGDALLGTDPAMHGILFSTFSQTDAIQRLMLAWGALGALTFLLAIAVCIGLKQKDVRLVRRDRNWMPMRAALSRIRRVA